MKKTNPNTKEIAQKYNIDARTVRRWRRAGAPLNDPEAMELWLAKRKHLPSALPVSGPTTAGSVVIKVDDAKAKGLPSHLARLTERELALYNDMLEAVRQGDVLRANVLMRGWLQTGDQLRKSDIALEEARREAGELVPREVVERGLEVVGYTMNASFNDQLRAATAKIMALGPDLKPGQVYEILSWTVKIESIMTGAAIAAATQDAPTWLTRSIVGFWDHNQHRGLSDRVIGLANTLVEFLKTIKEPARLT